jgi:urease accessory protein
VTPLALTRLLQLSSQALPIGGYSHSQGLESAIEQRIVVDEGSVLRWILDVLEFSMNTFEIPRLKCLSAAWAVDDHAAVGSLNEDYLATRESAELRAAAVQMGFSLRALLYVLPDMPAATIGALRKIQEPSLPCVWSAVATAWQIEAREAALGYVWAWAENQVLVSMKTLPLGQSAGQRVLLVVGAKIARLDADNLRVPEESYSNFAPALAILSAQHETQYSRLFRS